LADADLTLAHARAVRAPLPQAGGVGGGPAVHPAPASATSPCPGGGGKLPLALALLLAACSSEPTPVEKATADARAVAEVEAIQKQKPPPQPLAPQAILFDDIQKHDLFGPGCAFAPGGSMGAVLLAQDKIGFLKLEDRIVSVASDPGSTRLPGGAWSRYVGKAFSLRLARTERQGSSPAAETLRWPARVTITDAHDQMVYDATGAVQCSS
jgi:hypothetical protein